MESHDGLLRFPLSFRDVEEMLAMHGISLSYETVREWCLKFGQTYANDLRRKSSRPGDRWHLDEVFLKINGLLHYLWRAVDQDGDVLQPNRVCWVDPSSVPARISHRES